ncbi:uncharacterized protein LOC103703945 [Phoenix dactylifera]|uniref:Uncharacterized protein LOC103703945 n=1 Tax=Phoenix dactylifera TaxID=42345 RepID=A0A8B9A8A1_PHODC|nr:uncharacterized protein LOC103703945 [Phoenix dactylifera]
MVDAGPPRLDLRTAGHVLRRSWSLLLAALPALLLAALLLLSFRSALLAGTLRLASVSDRDPAVRSLLSRLPPRRRPFLQLTRVGTLDEDFFSDSAAGDRRASRRPASSSNVSFPAPVRLFLVDGSLGFPRFPKSVKIRVPDFPSSPFLFSFPDGEGGADDAAGDRDQAVDLRIFGRGLDLDRQDATAILYLLTLLSSTHTLAILGFILSYTCALGVVFVAVTASLLQKPVSITGTIYSGARVGIWRLTGFVFLRWAARDALVQFLCIWFFADVRDQNELFKLFVKVKLMPFYLSPLNPWSGPRDEALSGFFFVWALLDTVVSVVFALVPWVVIIDHNLRRRGRDAVREGCYLISMMPAQALLLKCLETLACGNLGRTFAMMVGGRLFAEVFHSVAEVYFIVVWLIFYFAARCREGELEGRRFGRQDLEECINGLR